MIEFDKPVRIIAHFYGANRKYAIVYQDLTTKDFEVQRSHTGIKDGFKTVHSRLLDAENTAEDWVMPQ